MLPKQLLNIHIILHIRHKYTELNHNCSIAQYTTSSESFKVEVWDAKPTQEAVKN